LLAPHSTRFVLAADVARLRAAPSLAPYFAQWSADRSCQARIASRMRRIIAFARDATLSDLLFVFDGPVSRDELSQCVRDADRTRARARAVEYRGVSLVQHAIERDPSLLPSADVTELAQLTPSLLIAGPSGAVRATIDRALAAPSSTSEALIAPLKTLSDRLSSGYALALVSLIGPRRSGPLESLISDVEGLAVGVAADDRLRAEAILACANFDAPRSVADALSLQQAALAREPVLAPVRALIERASIERRASDVRATIDLSADELSLTVLAVRELGRLLAQSGADAPSAPASDASITIASDASITREVR
jgi:hypothetical protein